MRLLLRQADFETACRIAAAINEKFPGLAYLADAGTVELDVRPERGAEPNSVVAVVGALRVTPDVAAKVLINERAGTIVVGENVRLSRVALTHGNLAVITSEMPQVAQPAPFSEGVTTVVPRTQVDVHEEKNPVTVLEESPTVGDLATALNALGATPRDLSLIFQQLKAAGALHADLEFN